MNGGWLCERGETEWIQDSCVLSLLKRGLRGTDCQQEKEERDSSFSLLMDRSNRLGLYHCY